MPTRPAPMSAQPRRSADSARRRARRRRSMSARSGGTLVRAHANVGVVLSGIASRRALLDQGLDLGLLVTAVAAQRPHAGQLPGLSPAGRSEEHTSELQALMRISYAVLCLKKNKYYYHYENEQ